MIQLGRLLQRPLQCDLQLVRHHLGQSIALAVAQAHHAADIADDRLGAHRAKSDDLRHAVAPVLFAHVLNEEWPTVVGNIDVDIGRIDSLGVQEALKQQPVADGVDIGNLQQVRHQRARCRAARDAGDAIRASVPDKVAHDQEVTREPHLFDDTQLHLNPVSQHVQRRGHGRVVYICGVGVIAGLERRESAGVLNRVANELLSFRFTTYTVALVHGLRHQTPQVTFARERLRRLIRRVVQLPQLDL